ncbi:MAG: fructosamine kinase family protein [Kordiimonadaceae bacterium]|nr:fructosamine kinase family protein [Kordiimonadaceae bacterium]MBO6567911.1 fructosamine kinase family protein [Kordiimonadaceae bacterium]MBO6964359.1 fructosamine kinase family protein [Kordiimonadaceae bacterium]
MAGSISSKLEAALGAKIVKSRPLSGGDIADVSLLSLDDERSVVAKRPRMDQPDTTAVEKMMLKHLGSKSKLPVPDVLFQTKGLLVISHIAHDGATDLKSASADAARHIAGLHSVRPKGSRPFFGFDKDTYIGPLPQQNKACGNWVEFFTEHRLLAMAGSATRTGKMPTELMARVEGLAEKLPDLLPAAPASSLLHGDLWSGNMLLDGNQAAGFIDPAISYGHAEMDLAFIEMMGGLAPEFFDAYAEINPIEPEFHTIRKHIYKLWPLLVHVRLFGGGYVQQVDAILAQFE